MCSQRNGTYLQLFSRDAALVKWYRWIYTFYIKFIVICKVYINRFHYFCLPFLYNNQPFLFSYSGHWLWMAMAMFCTNTIKHLPVCCYIHTCVFNESIVLFLPSKTHFKTQNVGKQDQETDRGDAHEPIECTVCRCLVKPEYFLWYEVSVLLEPPPQRS